MVVINFKFVDKNCEITFSVAISLHTILETILKLSALIHGLLHNEEQMKSFFIYKH